VLILVRERWVGGRVFMVVVGGEFLHSHLRLRRLNDSPNGLDIHPILHHFLVHEIESPISTI